MNERAQEQSKVINIEVMDTQNVYKPPQIDSALLDVWNKFKKSVVTKSYKGFEKVSLIKVEACHKTLDLSLFWKNCFQEVFDSTMIELMSDTSYTGYVEKGILIEYLPKYLAEDINVQNKSFELNQFQMQRTYVPPPGWTITFDFVKTKKGYKFYGYNSYGGPCCH